MNSVVWVVSALLLAGWMTAVWLRPDRFRVPAPVGLTGQAQGSIRAVAERALVRHGYSVVSAADGDEGLDAIGRGEEFDLVISDVVMPSMDGPAMVRAIRKQRPALPVLFMSGYAEAQLRGEINITNMHFLPKPFSVAQIAEATDWASHTVRGFLAGLKKRGIQVEVLERVRQAGPNKEGARGSYTIYRVAN